MPRSKKPAGQAIDSRNGRQVELTSTNRDKAPAVPRGLKFQSSKQLWQTYWSDVISGLVHPSETMIVERWIRNTDRYRTLTASVDENSIYITKDESGDVVDTLVNPAFSMALKLEASIRADEAQIGYGPKNRAALGIAVVQQQMSLAEMNQRYRPQETDAELDPRLIESTG